MKGLTNKLLSEWTLREIKAECEKHECCTVECPAYRLENERRCRIKYPPNTWDLSEPLRWTEQDKEDSKIIKRVLNGFQIDIVRDTLAQLRTIAKDGYPSEYINSDMFPSFKPGESATLYEILGDEE